MVRFIKEPSQWSYAVFMVVVMVSLVSYFSSIVHSDHIHICKHTQLHSQSWNIFVPFILCVFHTLCNFLFLCYFLAGFKIRKIIESNEDIIKVFHKLHVSQQDNYRIIKSNLDQAEQKYLFCEDFNRLFLKVLNSW